MVSNNIRTFFASETDVEQVIDSPNWYYLHDGKQVGPIDNVEFMARISNKVVAGNVLCWTAKYGAEWRPANKTELWLRDLGAPPPLPTSAINNAAAYTFASLPVVGLVIEAVLQVPEKMRLGIILAYFVSYGLLAGADSRAIAKGGHTPPNFAWALFFAPVICGSVLLRLVRSSICSSFGSAALYSTC